MSEDCGLILNNMIEVLNIISGLWVGGVQTFLIQVTRPLLDMGIRMNFVVQTNEEQHYDSMVESLGCRIHHLPNLTTEYKNFDKEFQLLLQSHPEYKIVHSHLNFANTHVLRVAKRKGVPFLISHSHNDWRKLSEGSIKRYFGLKFRQYNCSKLATHLVGCSQNATMWLYGNFFKDKTRKVITNGIDVSKFSFNLDNRLKIRKSYKIDNDTTVFIHTGSFNPVKNHKFLIELFYHYKKINSEFKIFLCGEGELKSDILQLIREKCLEDNFIFTGAVDNVYEYLSASDVFLLPSLYEGLSFSTIEAQANGLRCIVANSVPEEAVVLDSTDRIDNFEINYWLKALPVHERLDAQCRINRGYIVKEKYDLKVTINQLKELYNEIMK